MKNIIKTIASVLLIATIGIYSQVPELAPDGLPKISVKRNTFSSNSSLEISGGDIDKAGNHWVIGDDDEYVDLLRMSLSFVYKKDAGTGKTSKYALAYSTGLDHEFLQVVSDQYGQEYLVVGNTGNNNLKRTKRKSAYDAAFYGKVKTLNKIHGKSPKERLVLQKKLKQEEQERNKHLFDAKQKSLLRNRPISVCVYSLDSVSQSPTGINYLGFIGKAEILHEDHLGGAMDIEAGVVDLQDNGDFILYLIEALNPFNPKGYARVEKLNLSQETRENNRVKGVLSHTAPVEFSHLVLGEYGSRVTDAHLDELGQLYILTDVGILKIGDSWKIPKKKQAAEFLELPPELGFVSAQLEAIYIRDGTIYLGSDSRGTIDSLVNYKWDSVTISTALQKSAEEIETPTSGFLLSIISKDGREIKEKQEPIKVLAGEIVSNQRVIDGIKYDIRIERDNNLISPTVKIAIRKLGDNNWSAGKIQLKYGGVSFGRTYISGIKIGGKMLPPEKS